MIANDLPIFIMKVALAVSAHGPLEHNVKEIKMPLHAAFAEDIAQIQVWCNVWAGTQRIGIGRGSGGTDPFVKMVAEDLSGGGHATGRFGVNASAPALRANPKRG